MRIFDMHADIGTNLLEREEKGEKDIFKNCHYNNLKNGDIKGVFMACFFCGEEDYERMQKMIINCKNTIIEHSDLLQPVKNANDLIETDKILSVISVEGMCGIKDDAEEKIEWMYENGVRVASLVWNESNTLAQGWPNNPLKGLSETGKSVVKKMNELGMIIDVSHINEKGFWDIVELSTKPVIATHSNIRSICNHQRNLTDQQCKAIALKGGLIGLNAAGAFIDENRDGQTSLKLAKHARYMADLVGVEHVACGFDYMDFLNGEDKMAKDLRNASYSQNLVNSLFKCGFSQKEISMICFENVYNFLREQL